MRPRATCDIGADVAGSRFRPGREGFNPSQQYQRCRGLTHGDSRIREAVISKAAWRDWAMPAAVKLREDYSADALQAGEGFEPKPAALVAGCDPGWERSGRSAEDRRDGSPDIARLGSPVQRSRPGRSVRQLDAGAAVAAVAGSFGGIGASIVETGPEVESDGMVRWRRVALKRVISAHFGVDYHERSVGKLLRKLGFSHMSARPRHPAQNERLVAAFKNVWPAPSARRFVELAADQSALTYPASEDSSRPIRQSLSGPAVIA
jgi:hypothetical protein